MIEPLNLGELAQAIDAVGLTAWTNSRGFVLAIPGKRKRCFWRGISHEHGWLLIILRDAVRKVAPGSYCLPMFAKDEPPFLVVILDISRLPIETDPLPSPYYGKGQTETESWAHALVSLYRARLLPVTKLGDEPQEGKDHHASGAGDDGGSFGAFGHGANDTGGGG